MNERRRRVYLSIIPLLLTFPEELAISILEGNYPIFIQSDEPDIFDEGLLETMLNRCNGFTIQDKKMQHKS